MYLISWLKVTKDVTRPQDHQDGRSHSRTDFDLPVTGSLRVQVTTRRQPIDWQHISNTT